MRFQYRGVTLIELMVVIVVVAILAAIAVPSYRNYVLRAQRTDATAALLRIASAQEKFYLQNNTYASNAQLGTAPPNGLGIGATEHGWYTLTVAASPGGLAVGYTAQAQAPAASPQFRDVDCRNFTIAETGARNATTAGGAANTDACWR